MKKPVLGALMLALALSAAQAAVAQPATKLTAKLDDVVVWTAWCSAVFLEEAQWYDEDNAWGEYYEDLSASLDFMAIMEMDSAGLREAEQDEIWELFDDAAYDLADTDEDAFLDERGWCIEDFGDMAQRPKD